MLADNRYKAGDWREAVAACREAIRLNPDLFEARSLLIRSYLRSREFVKADAEFQILLRFYPASRDVWQQWYEQQKKANEARKRQKVIEIKEIKLRPGIDDHDYDVKMKSVRRFFEEGDKVKVTLRFRGREMAHVELGARVLQRVKADTAEMAKVESEPSMEGRQMTMVLAPR